MGWVYDYESLMGPLFLQVVDREGNSGAATQVCINKNNSVAPIYPPPHGIIVHKWGELRRNSTSELITMRMPASTPTAPLFEFPAQQREDDKYEVGRHMLPASSPQSLRVQLHNINS